MISHTPQERELYEARLKLERDEATRLLGAREEGREEGERIGKLIGVVQTLQQLLGIEVSPSDKLRAQSEENLSLLVETLQSRLRDREAS